MKNRLFLLIPSILIPLFFVFCAPKPKLTDIKKMEVPKQIEMPQVAIEDTNELMVNNLIREMFLVSKPGGIGANVILRDQDTSYVLTYNTLSAKGLWIWVLPKDTAQASLVLVSRKGDGHLNFGTDKRGTHFADQDVFADQDYVFAESIGAKNRDTFQEKYLTRAASLLQKLKGLRKNSG